MQAWRLVRSGIALAISVFALCSTAASLAAEDREPPVRAFQLDVVDGATSVPIRLEAGTIYRLRLSHPGNGADFLAEPLSGGLEPVGLVARGRSNADVWTPLLAREAGALLKLSTPQKRSFPATLEIEAWSTAAEREALNGPPAIPGVIRYGKLMAGARAYHPVHLEAGRPLLVSFRSPPESADDKMTVDLVVYDETLQKVVARRPGLSLDAAPSVAFTPEETASGVIALFGRDGTGWYRFAVVSPDHGPDGDGHVVDAGTWTSVVTGAGLPARSFFYDVPEPGRFVIESEDTGDRLVYRLSLRDAEVEDDPTSGKGLIWQRSFGSLGYQQTQAVEIERPGRYRLKLMPTRGFGTAAFRFREAPPADAASGEAAVNAKAADNAGP